MVRVELGGHPIISIPGIEVGTSRTRVRQRTSNSSKSLFTWSSTKTPLVVTSDTDDFDDEILSHFQEEGYQVTYMPYSGKKAEYNSQLEHLADPLELGESYAIVGKD